ncbi:MAG: glutaredoxin family protein [Gammaproteobacteria bacterium]|nr:glutaredoxin family protein [Gammaproteobacteria bacterium]
MIKVDYYTKYDCSLCDEGVSILRKFPDIDVNIIDVEDDIEKYQSYLLRIPVISYDNGKIELGWPFGEKDIQEIVLGVKG